MERTRVLRHVQRWLAIVATIGAAVVLVLAGSSRLVSREIAWTSSRAPASLPLPVRLRYADTVALFAAVDRFVENEMRDGRVPGLALALVHRDGMVHARGFGIADPSGRPVTPATPFILGSLSKSFTALAMMQLVGDTRVALDAPVQRYLPWFSVRDRRASAAITVRHLLNHTSGIPRSAGLQLVRGGEAHTRAEEERLMVHVRLDHSPGTAFEYSNANYWLLGLVLEAVTDTSYADYVRAHILAPLGMTRTYTSETDAQSHGLAQGYRVWFGFPRAETLPFYQRELAVGYLMSCAEDMARYLIAQLNGGSDGGAPVISSAGLAELQQPPRGSPYAMGWLTDVVDDTPVLWHTGAVANYHADMLLIPSTGWGVVLLANANNFALEGQLSDGVKAVASLLIGYAPPKPTWLRFRTEYAFILAACIAWLAWRVSQVIGLRRWYGTAHPASGGRPPRRLGAMLDPGVAVGLLVGVPLLVGTPLSTLQWFVPDVTDWLTVNAFTAIAIGIIRLVLADSGGVKPQVRSRAGDDAPDALAAGVLLAGGVDRTAQRPR